MLEVRPWSVTNCDIEFSVLRRLGYSERLRGCYISTCDNARSLLSNRQDKHEGFLRISLFIYRDYYSIKVMQYFAKLSGVSATTWANKNTTLHS